MAIWGIGANYNDPDGKKRNVLRLFLASGRAYIGYSQAQAPSLHRMLGTIKAGDIIYVKSFWAKRLNIKALGIVTDPTAVKTDDMGTGISVKWKKDFKAISFDIDAPRGKNNVYSNTLYEEFNPEIANLLINELIR